MWTRALLSFVLLLLLHLCVASDWKCCCYSKCDTLGKCSNDDCINKTGKALLHGKVIYNYTNTIAVACDDGYRLDNNATVHHLRCDGCRDSLMDTPPSCVPVQTDNQTQANTSVTSNCNAREIIEELRRSKDENQVVRTNFHVTVGVLILVGKTLIALIVYTCQLRRKLTRVGKRTAEDGMYATIYLAKEKTPERTVQRPALPERHFEEQEVKNRTPTPLEQSEQDLEEKNDMYKSATPSEQNLEMEDVTYATVTRKKQSQEHEED